VIPAAAASVLSGLLVLSLDPFAERIAHETANLNRRLHATFGFLHGLSDALGLIVNVLLVNQANLFEEGLQSRLHDFGDDVFGFALRPELLRQHLPFARHDRRIKTRCIERLRIGGGDMHGQFAAQLGQFIPVPGRLQRAQPPDFAESPVIGLCT